MTKNNKSMGDGPVFFGSCDRKVNQDGDLNPNGKVLSEYPAWMHNAAIEDLNEEISQGEKNLKRYKSQNLFDSESLYKQDRDLSAKKAKLEIILESKPKLNGKQKDEYYNEYNRLGNEIRNYLFTKSEMTMGTCSPHEEAERMVNSCDITVKPEIAKALNLKTTPDGRLSRDQAVKGWKTLGGYFGEPTSTETLRRDRTTIRSRH